ncbi:hypothetical protein [Clavibacter michiganensis]|uniref:hypothetical protein n=1 Tax=Clavibacter michiganensis TaxID=28447 RepID=UPI001F4D5B45|nr:hypothetical protein [Clavibacter michiganensis]
MPDLDPRLVALYDGDNPDGPDHDFDRALAEEVGAAGTRSSGSTATAAPSPPAPSTSRS